MSQPTGTPTFSRFTRRALTAVGLIVLTLLLWQIIDVLLLVFAGALLAVILRGLAHKLSAHTPLSARWALAVVVLLIACVLGGIVWLFGSQMAAQVQQLTQRVPQMIDQLRQYAWGQFLIEHAPQPGEQAGGGGGVDVFSGITGAVSIVFGVLTNIILILFIGLYFAAQPEPYKRGLARLAPQDKRPRVLEVLNTTGRALWQWLLGQFVSMTCVGVLTTAGLLLLGMPLALALGLLAFLLEFIPLFGALIAAVPAVLLALTQGPTQALYVALLYLVVQQIEGNLIVPLVQREAVSLPPVATLVAVVIFGLLFGPLGVVLASPLAVMALVLVKMLYVEDALGDRSVHVPGEP